MKIRLTNHFKVRMLERNISLDHIRKAIRDPDEKEEVFDGKMRVVKKTGKESIEVIYFINTKGKGKEYIVATAYYL